LLLRLRSSSDCKLAYEQGDCNGGRGNAKTLRPGEPSTLVPQISLLWPYTPTTCIDLKVTGVSTSRRLHWTTASGGALFFRPCLDT
jgi:hypothetical protein